MQTPHSTARQDARNLRQRGRIPRRRQKSARTEQGCASAQFVRIRGFDRSGSIPSRHRVVSSHPWPGRFSYSGLTGPAAIPAIPARPVNPKPGGRSMKTLRGAAVALCAVLVTIILLGATLAPGARADQWDKKTIVTFNDAVEVPGQVLPAGTYVFRLADSISNRHIVQIWNADEDQVLATIMTIPNTRFETPDDSLFQFDERPGDSPQALKVWFYPGNNTGEEFIYSRYSYRQSNTYRQ